MTPTLRLTTVSVLLLATHALAARKHQKGGLTAFKTCQALVARASAAFVCQSNGQAGSYEKFRLYNRDTDKQLGGDTGFEQCLNSTPK